MTENTAASGWHLREKNEPGRAHSTAHHEPHFFHYPTPPLTQTRGEIPVHRRWHLTKIYLGCASVICSIIILGIGGGISLLGVRIGSVSFWLFSASAAGLAILWQIIEFMLIRFTRRHRGMHPGAHIAIYLIIWAFCLTGGTVNAIYLNYDIQAVTDADSVNSGTAYVAGTVIVQSKMVAFLRLEGVLLVFTMLLWLFNLILFFRACVETQQLNNVARPIYVQVVMAGGRHEYLALSEDDQEFLYNHSTSQVQSHAGTELDWRTENLAPKPLKTVGLASWRETEISESTSSAVDRINASPHAVSPITLHDC